MAKEKIVLAQLDLDVKGLVKAAQESEKAVEKLRKELKKCRDAGSGFSDESAKLEAQLKDLTTVYEAQTQAIKAQTAAQDTLAKSQNSLNAAQQNAAGTAGQATAAVEKQANTFKGYRDKVTGALQDLNVFNGGLGGLISRMDEAGGAGPLLSGAFKSIGEGIGGMTKSSMAFIATPIGAVIATIGLVLEGVISYFRDTQEGIDKVTAVTRPLQSVFQALIGVVQNVGKYLSEAFTNPGQAIEDFATLIKENIVNRFTGMLELIPNLGKAIGLLFEGEFAQAGKVAADAVGKVALGTENITDKVKDAAGETGKFLTDAYNNGKRIDDLQKALDKSQAAHIKRTGELGRELDKNNAIVNDASLPIAEREKAALNAIAAAKEQSRLMDVRLVQEQELLRLKLMEGGLTNDENKQLAEMAEKRQEALTQAAAQEKALQSQVNAIRSEGAAQQKERRQQLLEDSIEKHRQELELFVAKGSTQAKSLEDSIAFEQDASKKRLALLKEELNAGFKTRTEYDTAVHQEKNALAQKVTANSVAYAKATLALELQTNKSKLEEEKELTQELVNEENKRLEHFKDKRLEILEMEFGTNEEIIAQKRATNTQLSIEDVNYLTAKSKTEEEFRQQNDDNQKAFEAQVKQRSADEKAAADMLRVEEAATEYEQKLAEEELRHEEEMARLKEELDDKKITQQQYEEFVRLEQQKTASIKNQLAIDNAKTQLGSMQNVANAIGESFGQSKELAVAQATMNAGQAILGIWSGQISGNPVIDTALKVALTAGTAIKTGKEIQKITSAKKPKQPKFEKGGLLGVGGKRHSAGGTLFTGADGTRFEAEQGELIGVMNRNAARHFMAFNNAFPAGGSSAPNYFAGGGIVSREIAAPGLNADELAVKIANANRLLPPPVVAVQDIVTEGNSYVQVRQGADF